MKTTTRDHQVKEVVEGLALGVLALRVDSVPSGKVNVEFALKHALGEWSHANAFPGLSRREGPNYIWLGIGESERRKWVSAAWRSGQRLKPYLFTDDSPEECLEFFAQSSSVPPTGWLELARLFVNDFDENRSHPS